MARAGPAAPAGAVLCGGRSSRFGCDKALVDADGRPLGVRVIEALRDGGADPVVAVGGTAGGRLGVPTIADRNPGAGPLAALSTVLRWAGTGLVVVVPCDLPLLSRDHVAALVAGAEVGAGHGVAAVAVVAGRPEPCVACWPASSGRAITEAVRAGERAWRVALDAGPWTGVELPPAAVADADTPAELEALLSEVPDRR